MNDQRLLAVVLALTAFGCSVRAELDRRIADTSNQLHQVEDRGALQCAPRELAVARSHLEFAQLERGRGFPTRARDHLDVADENVRAAAQLSLPGQCSNAERASVRVALPPDAGSEPSRPAP